MVYSKLWFTPLSFNTLLFALSLYIFQRYLHNFIYITIVVIKYISKNIKLMIINNCLWELARPLIVPPEYIIIIMYIISICNIYM